MNFSKITDKAKGIIQRRGGTEGLKQDAQELRDIAKGEGKLTDKAKAAASALKDPGAAGNGGETPAAEPQATDPASADPGPSGTGEAGASEPSETRPA